MPGPTCKAFSTRPAPAPGQRRTNLQKARSAPGRADETHRSRATMFAQLLVGALALVVPLPSLAPQMVAMQVQQLAPAVLQACRGPSSAGLFPPTGVLLAESAAKAKIEAVKAAGAAKLAARGSSGAEGAIKDGGGFELKLPGNAKGIEDYDVRSTRARPQGRSSTAPTDYQAALLANRATRRTPSSRLNQRWKRTRSRISGRSSATRQTGAN